MFSIAKKIIASNIVVLKSVSYFSENITEYVETFNQFKKLGVINDSTEFSDKKWKLFDEVNFNTFSFDFDELSFKAQNKIRKFSFRYEDLADALRCFMLLILGKYSLGNLYAINYSIISAFNGSHYFNNDYLKDAKQLYKKNNNSYYHVQFQMDFIDFFEELNLSDEYFNLLESAMIKKQQLNCRILPSFESIFKLGHIIESLLKTKDLKLLERFFPIVLWWYITGITPLRTTELCIIPYDCTIIVDNKYKLLIRRSSTKGVNSKDSKRENYNLHSISGSYSDEEVEIDKDTFDLINKYKNLVDEYDYVEDYYGNGETHIGPRKFLFSYRSYFKLIRKGYKKSILSNRYYLDFFNAQVFNSLLNCFYTEVVYKRAKYSVIKKIDLLSSNNEIKDFEDIDVMIESGEIRELLPYEIEKVQCMDTRHYAIMNMVLSNIPIVAIKILCGHRDIKTTFSYFNQMDRFIENYTYYLSNKLAKNEGTSVKLFNFKLNSPPIQKTLYYLEQIEKGNVFAEDCNNFKGWCIYKHPKSNMQNDYPCKEHDSECTNGCKYYVPKLNESEDITNVLKDNHSEISSSIKVIQEIIKNRKKIKDFDTIYHAEIEKINSGVSQNARIIKEHVIQSID